jgi:hypothetical protein
VFPSADIAYLFLHWNSQSQNVHSVIRALPASQHSSLFVYCPIRIREAYFLLSHSLFRHVVTDYRKLKSTVLGVAFVDAMFI